MSFVTFAQARVQLRRRVRRIQRRLARLQAMLGDAVQVNTAHGSIAVGLKHTSSTRTDLGPLLFEQTFQPWPSDAGLSIGWERDKPIAVIPWIASKRMTVVHSSEWDGNVLWFNCTWEHPKAEEADVSADIALHYHSGRLSVGQVTLTSDAWLDSDDEDIYQEAKEEEQSSEEEV